MPPSSNSEKWGREEDPREWEGATGGRKRPRKVVMWKQGRTEVESAVSREAGIWGGSGTSSQFGGAKVDRFPVLPSSPHPGAPQLRETLPDWAMTFSCISMVMLPW